MTKEIMIVDDEKAMLNLASILLRRQGYIIKQAHNSYIAMELLEEKVPDLIVLDVMMPGIDGFELCKYIRKSAEYERVPIIMFSSLMDSVTVEKALKCGANGFLTKATMHRELVPKVNQWLKRAEESTKPNPSVQK